MRAFMNQKSANSNNDNKGSSSIPTTTVFSNDSNLLQSIYFSHMQQNLLLLEEDETPMSAYSHLPSSSSNNNNNTNNNNNGSNNNTDPSPPLDGSNNLNQQQQQYNFVDLDGFGSVGPLSQFDIPLSINITGYQLTHKEEKKQRERELKREAARLKKQMESRKTAVLRDESDEMEKRMKYDGLSFFRNGFMIFTNSSETELDEGSDRGRPSFASQDGSSLFDEGAGITTDIMYGEYQQQEDEAAHDEVDLLEQQLIYFYPNTVEKRSQLNIVGFIQSFLIFSDSFAPLIPDTFCSESFHDFDLITNGSPSPNSSSSNYEHTESLLSASLKAEATHSHNNNAYMNSKECNHPVNLIQFNHSKMAIVRYYNVIYCLCAPISTPNSILHENLMHILNSFAFIYGSYNIKEILSKKSYINERQVDIDKVSTDFYVSSLDCKYESTIDVFEDIAEGPFPARSMFHDNNLKIPWIASPYSPIVSNSYKRKKSTNRWNAEQQRVLDDFCLLIKMYTVSQPLQSPVDESLPIKAMTQRIFPFAIPYTEIPEKNIFIKAMGILNQLQDAYGSNRVHISPSYSFSSVGVSLSGMVQKQLENISHRDDHTDQENNKPRKGSLIGSALFFINESVIAVNNLDEHVLQYILFRLRCIEKNFCEYKDNFDESFNAEIVSSPTTKVFSPSPYSTNASRQDPSSVTPIPLRHFKNTPSTPVTNSQSPMAKPIRSNSFSNNSLNNTPGGNITPRGTPSGVSPLVRSATKSGSNSSNNLLRATTTPEARQRMMAADNSPGGMSTLSVQSSTTSVITSPTTNSNETSVFGVNAYKTSDDWYMFETTSVQDLQGSKDDEHETGNVREKISRINLDYNLFIISGKKDSEFILLSEEDQIDYTVVYLNSDNKLSTIMEKHVLITYRYRDLSLCTIWKFEDTFHWRCELNDCIIKIRTEMRPILRQISRKMDRTSYTNLLLMREESAPYKLHGNVRCKRPATTNTMNNASGNSNNPEQDSAFCLIYDQFNNMVTSTNTSSKTFFVNVAKARNTFLSSEHQQVEWWNEASQNHQHYHKPSKQVSKLFLKNDRDGYIYSKQLFGGQVYYYKQQQQDTTTQPPTKTAAYFSLSKLEQSVRESIRSEFKINLL
ncbi:hypothetical protein C9374_012044 [Naegleria lovaniensis]|uniref:Uncharacterized protein n=1 Tax=Naegleria lovaniensis TaxID=51637 RepID=A0AA88KEW6_NAELO|nr:uncharacterized protein C9374_012044 [Naegleria lovaniensis]KAG2373581.1 hypothetical protein C9374_012044 [Naegleria lovaniensis]